jgi:hypothetical protein
MKILIPIDGVFILKSVHCLASPLALSSLYFILLLVSDSQFMFPRLGQATVGEIRDAYRRMAAIYHPDKARTDKSLDLVYASQIWQQLNEAKHHLFDEVRRKFYDIKIGVTTPTNAEA